MLWGWDTIDPTGREGFSWVTRITGRDSKHLDVGEEEGSPQERPQEERNNNILIFPVHS